MIYKIEDLVATAPHNLVEKDGRYIFARPDNWRYRNLIERIKDAWTVFTGKADAVKWGDV